MRVRKDRTTRAERSGIFACLLLLATSVTLAEPIAKGNITIKLEPVAAGLTAPIVATNAGDGSGRLFVVEQSGQIRIVHNGLVLPEPFLDIADRLPALNPFFDERGLLGLAFHPDYESNGRFFVRYSAPREGAEGEPCFGSSRGCHSEVLAEFSVSSGDPNLADPASGRILFTIDEPQFNHNAGDVAFGPDGFLYFTLGDGGGGNDGLADSPPSHGPIGNGQNIDTALGAMLRIDVDGAAPYVIPPDNPFVGSPGVDEIYAYGMRNPYRFSFDDGPGGDGGLYLADVGQNLFEEISLVVNGGNYGWVVREGLHCFDPLDPRNPPDTCTEFGLLGEPLIDPIFEYSHPGSGFSPEGGITVVGGYVYRGARSPSLMGSYLFGDFAQAFVVPSGSLYYLERSDLDEFSAWQLQIGDGDRPYGRFLKGYGEDEDGEVYVCGSQALAPFGTTGVIERIVTIENPGLDVKPGSCRNPVNRRSRGNLPVALVGTENFDVSNVDPSTIALTRGGSTRAFTASLDGSDTSSPGTGSARITLNLLTNELTMDLTIDGLLGTQIAQHVHGPAAVGQNGPVVFPLPGPGDFDNFTIVLTDEQKQLILDGLAYINVHTTRDPAGEIRGQIEPALVAPVRVATSDEATPLAGEDCDCHEEGADGIADLSLKFDTQEVISTLGLDVTDDGSVTLTVVGRQGPARVSDKTVFSFALQASQQVPPATSPATGSCSVTLDETSGEVAVGCSYDGLVGDAFAAHIHGPAGPGSNGPVIIPLTPTGTTSGVITGGGTLTPMEVQQILEGQAYINLHTATFPGGEIRGQIAGGEGFRASDCIDVLSPGNAPIKGGKSARSHRKESVGVARVPSR